MYKIYRKIVNSFQGDFLMMSKVVCFRGNLRLISGSLPDDQGGFTCMGIFEFFIYKNVY